MNPVDPVQVLVVGGGPAGLMAAECLCAAGAAVQLYDAMPSVGRKFLLAGKGGLNLTHAEPEAMFRTRYGDRQADVAPWLDAFGPAAMRDWARGLGIDTFVGTSGRVFPAEMKAAPLLRAWLQRLRHPPAGRPVQFHMRHRWTGWAEAAPGQVGLCFDGPQGPLTACADAVVLALGGASWPRLGSDGRWVPLLEGAGVAVHPLVPANCGFDVAGGWTPFFSERFAGKPFKSVALSLPGAGSGTGSGSGDAGFHRRGEFVATATGIEGSLVYAAARLLRDEIRQQGSATLWLDLLPDFSAARVLQEVSHPRGSRSLSSHLKSRLGIDGIKSALLHEVLPRAQMQDPAALAAALKALPLRLDAARPLAEAISTAGGVRFEAFDGSAMLRALPGVFCAGEMLDWEAPTGGYLLTAAMASGLAAGQAAWRHAERVRVAALS